MDNNADVVKKPFYKKWWFILIAVLFVFSVLSKGANKSKNDTSSMNNRPKTTQSPTPTPQPTAVVNDLKSEKKDALEEKENLVWRGKVRNDVTGNWRLSMYSSKDSQEKLAFEYYDAFFESDDEIHAVINAALKTTARINPIKGMGILDVSILKYIEGEEHDAKLLFSGNLIKQYWVYTDTGVIEEIPQD